MDRAERPLFTEAPHMCSPHADADSSTSANDERITLGAGDGPETRFFHYDGQGNMILSDSFDLTDPSWGLRYTGYPEQPVIVGRSKPMLEVFHQIARIGPTRASVLIRGCSGTGKELVARALASAKGGPFEAVNCALPTDGITFEDTFFGRVDKIISGAPAAPGAFQRAHTGTLLLDNIECLSPEQQAKLLRVLESKVVYRLGSSRAENVDVRVIYAANRDLADLVRRGHFREDLYYRIKVTPVYLPPLHIRRDDVPLLVAYFFLRNSPGSPRKVEIVSSQAIEELRSYDWPGNVRELANAVEAAMVSGEGQIVYPEQFRLSECPNTLNDQRAQQQTAAHTRPRCRQRSILNVESLLRQHSGAQAKELAQLAGCSHRTVQRSLRSLVACGAIAARRDEVDSRIIRYYLSCNSLSD